MPSLYANLLDPNKKSATLSSEPVKYEFKKSEEPPVEEKKPDASLRFQPVKRPQVAQKPKPRPSTAQVPSAKPVDNAEKEKKSGPILQNNSTFERWTANAEEDYEEDPHATEYLRRMNEERRQRGGRRKKKKKDSGARYVDWDSIYDPERPTRLEDYNGSEEQVQAAHDWKMRLHAHQFKRQPRRISPSEDEDDGYSRMHRRSFAPPSNYNFAPPSFDDGPITTIASNSVPQIAPDAPIDDDEAYVPPPPPTIIPEGASGEDAYLRRMRSAGISALPETPTLESEVVVGSTPPPPPPPPATVEIPISAPRKSPPSMPMPQAAPAPGTEQSELARPARPPKSAGTALSSAPVRYTQPPPPQPQSTQGPPSTNPELEEEEEDEDAPRTNRPGQKGFAKRLLEKYGWQQGQGLGASSDGITTILQHQKGKRKKRPDAEGGGWIGPQGGVAKIVGGKRQKAEDGMEWSIVAVFRGMLAGVDVQREIESGSLMQDIGSKMDEFGIVERLFLDREGAERDDEGTAVFVKFTSATSAYRAIQASDGKDFLGNGRTVRSAFFDEEKFENGVYS